MSGINLGFPAAGTLTHVWRPATGDPLDLSNPLSPVRMSGNPRGMWDAERVVFTQDYAGLRGGRHLGDRVLPRDGFWGLKVYGQPGADWLAVRSGLRPALRQGVLGRWLVRHPGTGTVRTLACRVSHVETLDTGWTPEGIGYGLLGVDLVAHEEPLWQGEDVVLTAPALNGITVPNFGDEPLWLRALIVGPTPVGAALSLSAPGVSGYVFLPFAIAAGAGLIIDTRPGRRVAYDATVAVDGGGKPTVTAVGAERTDVPLTSSTVAAVPSGTAAIAVLTGSTGVLQVTATPLYEYAA